MATTFEPMATYTMKRIPGDAPGAFGIPASQRAPGDTYRDIRLPAGLHQLRVLWKGTAAMSIRYRPDGATNSRVMVTLPAGHGTHMFEVAVPEGGGWVWFSAAGVTGADIDKDENVLGMTYFYGLTQADMAGGG